MQEIPNKKCCICGKVFYNLYFNNYIYKIKTKYFCSYNCMLQYEKRQENKQFKIIAKHYIKAYKIMAVNDSGYKKAKYKIEERYGIREIEQILLEINNLLE